MNVKSEKERIGEVAMKASKEAELEATFRKIEGDWKQAKLEVAPYKDYKDYFIVSSTEEINELLEDSLVTLSNVLAARFVDNIRFEVDRFYRKLTYLETLLDEWLTCQKSWMYLETIFNSPDIQKSLASDTKKFMQVDSVWKQTMKGVNDNPLAMRAINYGKDKKESLLDLFRQNNMLLDQIQKALDQYLEKKRTDFSRFFFLSNDELLLILAEANRNPDTVQPHLRKLFENIQRIEFGEDIRSEDIVGISSAEEEKIALMRSIKTRDPVERWLLNLESEMVRTVRRAIKVALDEQESSEENFNRPRWV